MSTTKGQGPTAHELDAPLITASNAELTPVDEAVLAGLLADPLRVFSLIAPDALLAARAAVSRRATDEVARAMESAITPLGIDAPGDRERLVELLVLRLSWLQGTSAQALDDARWLAALGGELPVDAQPLSARHG